MFTDGLEFEKRFTEMIARFRGAERGVDVLGKDVEAALLLEANRDPRLRDLLERRIHVANAIVDEETNLEDLEFYEGEERTFSEALTIAKTVLGKMLGREPLSKADIQKLSSDDMRKLLWPNGRKSIENEKMIDEIVQGGDYPFPPFSCEKYRPLHRRRNKPHD